MELDDQQDFLGQPLARSQSFERSFGNHDRFRL